MESLLSSEEKKDAAPGASLGSGVPVQQRHEMLHGRICMTSSFRGNRATMNGLRKTLGSGEGFNGVNRGVYKTNTRMEKART